ncbi:MAG: hypothetical protein ED859_15090 [Desulfuromonadales bacterium]|nr:MAG: hypothetical protein ED859_15090 [Desulfuromonadales bacterium]
MMNVIIKEINKPEWWFTVVFVGLIVGVIAAYAKDWIASLCSIVSERFNKYNQRREQIEQKEIQLLASDIRLVIMEYIRTAFHMAAALALVSLSTFIPVWKLVRNRFPEVDPISQMIYMDKVRKIMGIEDSQIGDTVVITVFGLLGFVLWYKAMMRFIVCEMARKRIRGER